MQQRKTARWVGHLALDDPDLRDRILHIRKDCALTVVDVAAHHWGGGTPECCAVRHFLKDTGTRPGDLPLLHRVIVNDEQFTMRVLKTAEKLCFKGGIVIKDEDIRVVISTRDVSLRTDGGKRHGLFGVCISRKKRVIRQGFARGGAELVVHQGVIARFPGT